MSEEARHRFYIRSFGEDVDREAVAGNVRRQVLLDFGEGGDLRQIRIPTPFASTVG